MHFYSAHTRGFYRTDVHGLSMPNDAVAISDEEHAAILTGQSEGMEIVPDAFGRPTLQARAKPDLIEYKEKAKRWIDQKAGEARQRFPSPGNLVEMEYKIAEAEALAFQDAGYPSDAVPQSVQDWATVKGWSAQQAAVDIIVTAGLWNGVLLLIRRLRLQGKAAVDASANHDAVDVALAEVAAALDMVQP